MAWAACWRMLILVYSIISLAIVATTGFPVDQTISSPAALLRACSGPGTSSAFWRPTGFITVPLCCGLRWYALVVEPSPTFRYRGSAADCPIPSFFRPSRLPFPAALWYEGLSGFSSNSPGDAPDRYWSGRLCLRRPKPLRHNRRRGCGTQRRSGSRKPCPSC